DYVTLYAICEKMEERDLRFQAINVAGLVAVLIAYWLHATMLVVFVGLLLVAVQVTKSYRERFVLARDFQRDRFDLVRTREQYKGCVDDATLKRLPNGNENIVIYKDFSPFVGAGYPLGGWSVAINISRPKQTLKRGTQPMSFTVPELYTMLGNSLERLAVPG